MTQRSRTQELLDELDADPQLAELLSQKLPARKPNDFEVRFDDHIKRLDDLVDELKQANRNFGARLDRIASDIGGLKGYYARSQVLDTAAYLAEYAGFVFDRLLTKNDLAALARNQLTGGPRLSFINADMIMQVRYGEDEEPAYIAAEISFTASARDSARAIQNSAFISRVTGTPCHPAVASVRNDGQVKELIDGGALIWLPLEDRDPPAE